MKSTILTLLLAFAVFSTTALTVSASGNDSPLQNMRQTTNPNILYDMETLKYFDIRENGYIDEI